MNTFFIIASQFMDSGGRLVKGDKIGKFLKVYPPHSEHINTPPVFEVLHIIDEWCGILDSFHFYHCTMHTLKFFHVKFII